MNTKMDFSEILHQKHIIVDFNPILNEIHAFCIKVAVIYKCWSIRPQPGSAENYSGGKINHMDFIINKYLIKNGLFSGYNVN